MELQSKSTVYSLSKDDILGLIAEKLRVPKERIVVNYHLKTAGGDDRLIHLGKNLVILALLLNNTTIRKGSVANV